MMSPMTRSRRTTRTRSGRLSRWWSHKDRSEKLATVLTALQVCAAAGMVVGAGVGLTYLDRHVHAAARFGRPPVIDLIDVPDGLRKTMLAKLAPFEATTGFEPEACAKIGRALETDPWVRRVNSVRRGNDLRIAVSCTYRLPAALVQLDGAFYLVDEERVRLPGVYRYQESLPLIQGVEGEPPSPGGVWGGADLASGMALARLIAPEAFAEQITGIQVHNYGGRRSPRDAHLVLTTDRAGRLIKWGSAPGEEIEENAARQKIAILRHNFERSGRVDAGFRTIDVSVYPDRFTAEG